MFSCPTLREGQSLEAPPAVSMSQRRDGAFEAPILQSAEALFAVDSGQRIMTWNSEAVRLFGHSAAAVLGQTCFSLVACTDHVGHPFCRSNCPVMRSLRRGAAPPPVQLSARRRGGDRVAIEVSTVALAAGGVPGAVIHLCRPLGESGLSDGEAPARNGMTRREVQVLAALCRGESTSAIAFSLGVSHTTLRNHVQHLLAKLGAHSRAEAVAVAYRAGLVRE